MNNWRICNNSLCFIISNFFLIILIIFSFLYFFHLPENKKKTVLCNELKAAGYRSDPIKAWKATLAKNEEGGAHENRDDEEEDGSEQEEEGKDFMYLLSMHLLSLTKEKKDALLRDRDQKVRELGLV